MTECDPEGKNPCCNGNVCGITKDYCSCPGCIDYRDESRWREGKHEKLVIDSTHWRGLLTFYITLGLLTLLTLLF